MSEHQNDYSKLIEGTGGEPPRGVLRYTNFDAATQAYHAESQRFVEEVARDFCVPAEPMKDSDRKSETWHDRKPLL